MWLRTWLGTGLLLLMMAGSLEAFWRQQGHFASVVDDDALWADARSKVDDDPSTVVTIGMSRMQLDFSSEAFQRRHPERKLVRLEATTRQVLSALASLAEDEKFRGTVIASVALPWVRDGIYPGFERELAHLETRYGLNARINRRAATILQSNLVILNARLGLRDSIESRATTGGWPRPYFLNTNPDRSREAHFDLTADLPAFAKTLENATRRMHRRGHLGPDQMLRHLKRAESLAARIGSRGGSVIFVRFPTSGGLWQVDQRYYPRARYWDEFAARSEIHTLHFQEVSALAAVDCPDGSHIDTTNRAAFTNALLDAIEERGWLGAP